MEKYNIYISQNQDGIWVDFLFNIAYSEKAAHKLVQKVRKAMNNQLCYFKKIS